ncbi:MAG: hypothetical protein ACPGUC_11555, partial [Gammaproteobacteria bacterium]
MNIKTLLHPSLLAVLLMGCVLPASAATLFFDDFEAYTAGASIAGNGGWTGDTQIVAGDSTALGSRVADGFQESGNDTYEIHQDVTGMGGYGLYTITFDAFARSYQSPPSEVLPSHNTSIGLDRSASNFLVFWNNARGSDGHGWSFYASNETDTGYNTERYIAGYDTPIELGIQLDTANMEMWGIYDFGAGNTGSTAHYSLTQDMLDGLDQFTLWMDMRTYTSTPVGGQYVGAQIDNILVEA